MGNGANALFWVDKWIHGQCIGDLAPHFIALVPKRKINKRTVEEALFESLVTLGSQISKEVSQLRPSLNFFNLWDIHSEIVLQPDVKDSQLTCLTIIYFGPIFGKVCI